MMKEQRSAMMDQILTAEAKQRLSNIAVVKPEKAETLENVIIQNAQRGTIQGKVTEAQLLDLLEQFAGIDKAATKVERVKHRFDDEDELDLDNLDL